LHARVVAGVEEAAVATPDEAAMSVAAIDALMMCFISIANFTDADHSRHVNGD
jgi:hypothetical protein